MDIGELWTQLSPQLKPVLDFLDEHSKGIVAAVQRHQPSLDDCGGHSWGVALLLPTHL
jgi:hypothetical protein